MWTGWQPKLNRAGVRRLGSTVGAALLLTACQPAATQVPRATAACADVAFPPLQSGSHLLGDTDPPVPYSSTPPTSGWHASGAPPVGVMDQALSEPGQVATLEAGGVVVTYSGMQPQDLEVLRERITSTWSDRVVLTEYPGLQDGEVAFASWGALQICDDVDLAALDTYVETYGNEVVPHR